MKESCKGECRRALSFALIELAREDEKIVVLASDSRGSVTLNDYVRLFPDQFVECGIAEQNEIGVAAGMALAGAKPFVCAPAAFLSMRSLEQIRLDICYNNVNVKICGVSGGLAYAHSGESHFAIHDIGLMAGFHNLTVLIPSDAVQTEWAVRELAGLEGPAYMRIGRNSVPQIYSSCDSFKVGKAQCLCEGKDLTIIACGEMVSPAIEAADMLRDEGIEARVLDMFTIRPLDENTVCDAAVRTGRILTVEEHVIANGLGNLVAGVVSRNCPVPVRMMGIPDEHIACGSQDYLKGIYGLTAEGIVSRAREFVRET